MKPAMKKHLKRASGLVGKFAEKEARKVISSSRLEDNRPLTIALKGENKPLVGSSSELFRAITSKVLGDGTTVFVGVLKTSSSFNIARFLHDGGTIEVTPAMRGMFFFLWKVSEGTMKSGDLSGRAAELWSDMPGGWRPLKDSTTHIVIPRRPFMEIVFRDAAFKKKVRGKWEMAIQAAMKEQAGT